MSAMLEIMAFGDDYVDIGMLRLLEKALPWEMRSEGSRKMRTVSSEAIDEDGIAEYLAAVIQTNTKLPLHKAMFRPDQIRAVCSVPFFSFPPRDGKNSRANTPFFLLVIFFYIFF
jgi:hypothetical protein